MIVRIIEAVTFFALRACCIHPKLAYWALWHATVFFVVTIFWGANSNILCIVSLAGKERITSTSLEVVLADVPPVITIRASGNMAQPGGVCRDRRGFVVAKVCLVI